MADLRSGDPNGVDRRKFLHLGATGLAAASLGGCASAAEPDSDLPAPADPAAPGAQAADAAAPGPPPGPPPPPEVGDLVDPAEVPMETWQEPWIWRQEHWPDESLELNVIQHQNPGPAPSPGNPNPTLFSYGGNSPAPTIRARGDTTVRLRVRNHLGLDHQMTPVGPCPDAFDLTPAMTEEVCKLTAPDAEEVPECQPFFVPEQNFQVVPARLVPGYELVDHANGQRAAHITNIHTHGLHVPPNYNPDGSLSDNVLLRIIPRADLEKRKESSNAAIKELRPYERVGSADYQIRLGEARHGAPEGAARQPHPPGTHWYHPHAHGSTHDQVASGMAGFLIVEGDVDDALNEALTGESHPHPEEKTGPYDYRERLIMFQRALLGSADLDAGPKKLHLRFPQRDVEAEAGVSLMRPGALERWRVLNGSVDGTGFKRFMVLEGQFVLKDNRLFRVEVEEKPAAEGEGEADGGGENGGEEPEKIRRLVPASRADVGAAKAQLYLLAFDGITLVEEDAQGRPRHTIEDLSEHNAGTESPLARPIPDGENPFEAMLRGVEDCYRDGDSLRRAFNRPNEVYMANANRADVFFKAPTDAAGKVFTIFAQEVRLDADNFQQRLQRTIVDGEPRFNRPPFDIVVGYIHVRGEPVEGGDLDVMSLRDALPEVPPFLHPVREDELRVGVAEAAARRLREGSLRTRVVAYSGYGGALFPFVPVPEAFAKEHPELEKLVWARHEDVPVLLPNYNRTMAIHSRFDLAENPDPGPPRKFVPNHEDDPKVLLGTAEEWVLYNNSLTLWGHRDLERFPQPGAYGGHRISYPIGRADGQKRFTEDPAFQITAKGNDHPFHIHINPAWVIRIDVPDESGVLHNILDRPRWMDTFPIPRNGGRVVFRTRFLDFTGTWVHHCHILLHEDNGMMQTMECTDDATRADYNPRRRVASHAMSGPEVDEIYPPPSPELMYRQSMGFVDPSPTTGQVYPGFELELPVLEDSAPEAG